MIRCETGQGYVQKARHERTMGGSERTSEAVQKYFINEKLNNSFT